MPTRNFIFYIFGVVRTKTWQKKNLEQSYKKKKNRTGGPEIILISVSFFWWIDNSPQLFSLSAECPNGSGIWPSIVFPVIEELDGANECKVMKGLPNTCHNYRTEGFQIPIKPFLFENLDLFGNPRRYPINMETIYWLTLHRSEAHRLRFFHLFKM